MPRLLTTSLAGMFFCMIAPLAAHAQGQVSGLPEGAGKELIEGVCTACHQTNQITRSSGYSRDGWMELTSTMIDLTGSSEQQGEIIQYLATHFPRIPGGLRGWCPATRG